jgi:hypothetical protein
MPSRATKSASKPTRGGRSPSADINHSNALKGDKEARRKDPHGHGLADMADQDEPSGAPSSERHRAETATSRIEEKKADRRPA